RHDAYLGRRISDEKRGSGLVRAVRIVPHSLGARMSLIDMIHQQLGAQEIQQISQQLGVDQSATQQAVQAAVPMMVGGMASTANQADGASSLQSLLGSQGGGLLENIGGMLGSGAAGGILGSLGGMMGGTADGGG